MSFIKNESVSDKDYCVYRLMNNTKKEIYHGIATDFEKRYESHRAGEVKATSHWDFNRDDIEKKIISEGLSESEASSDAHYLEGNPYKKLKNYEYIKTKGL